MRSAHWVELFWDATTLPVNTTRPSFWMFSSWSASTVTGASFESVAPLPPAAPSTLGAAAGGWVAGRAGRGRGEDDVPWAQAAPDNVIADQSASVAIAIPRLMSPRERSRAESRRA